MNAIRETAAARSLGWERPRAAHEVALDYLMHGIRTGRLAAGEQVSPEAIAAQIELSHVPVREAIKRLEGRGVLTYVPRKGHFVTELRLGDIETLVVLGRLLETEALERAVPQVTSDQIERMRSTVIHSRAQVGVDPGAVQADAAEFHTILMERGVPRLLLRQLDLLWSSMEAYRHFYYARPELQTATCSQHDAILDALSRRDVMETVAVFNKHRLSVAESTKRVAPFVQEPGR